MTDLNGARLENVRDLNEDILNDSDLISLLTVRSPEARIASAWLESPIEPPGFTKNPADPQFLSLLEYIVKNMHTSALHPRLRDIYSSCNVCSIQYNNVWKEEDGPNAANEFLDYYSILNEKIFEQKAIRASKIKTEKLFENINPKITKMIRQKYLKDEKLFNY